MTPWAWLLIVAGALLLIYEIAAVVRHWPTISQLTWRESAKRPWLPFAAGVLCGHLFL